MCALAVCVDCLGLNKPPPDLSVVIGAGLVQSVSQSVMDSEGTGDLGWTSGYQT